MRVTIYRVFFWTNWTNGSQYVKSKLIAMPPILSMTLLSANTLFTLLPPAFFTLTLVCHLQVYQTSLLWCALIYSSILPRFSIFLFLSLKSYTIAFFCWLYIFLFFYFFFFWFATLVANFKFNLNLSLFLCLLILLLIILLLIFCSC